MTAKNNEIQILRAFGMLFILLGHMPITLPNVLLHGYTFVSLFLAIAGFFVTLQFEKKYSHSTYSKIKIIVMEFINKFFRIIPLMFIWIMIYYMISHVVAVLFGWQYGDETRWLNELKAAALFYYNYYLAGLDIGGLFGQFWTLFVEIHLFLIWIIVMVFFRDRKAHVLISALFIVMTILFRPLTPVKLIRYATLAQADSFFMGALIASYFGDKEKNIKVKIGKIGKTLTGIFLIACLFISGFYFDNYLNYPNLKYSIYTMISGLILFLARENDGWFEYPKIFESVMIWLGNVSASIYVSHVLLYSCLYWNIYSQTTLIPDFIKLSVFGVCLQVVFLILFAAFIGYLSQILIERPYNLYGKIIINRIRDSWQS